MPRAQTIPIFRPGHLRKSHRAQFTFILRLLFHRGPHLKDSNSSASHLAQPVANCPVSRNADISVSTSSFPPPPPPFSFSSSSPPLLPQSSLLFHSLHSCPNSPGRLARLRPVLLPLFLGQLLAGLIAVTAVCSGLIAQTGLSLPLAQNLPHYTLLAIFCGLPSLVRLSRAWRAQSRLPSRYVAWQPQQSQQHLPHDLTDSEGGVSPDEAQDNPELCCHGKWIRTSQYKESIKGSLAEGPVRTHPNRSPLHAHCQTRIVDVVHSQTFRRHRSRYRQHYTTIGER
ncbi:unnamed protein product [Protopolystoma xenopodis]|uniref:Uncharacterized protein n=1 Tax=Protopolystoma xenopodis TaxID=117903 RepID=A0A3S5CSE1_9PLAT|nr:unnamed protein product [Protopolystoma xenopodis]